VARVFLSYATPDHGLARSVHAWLTADGHDVFFDRDQIRGIPVGDDWKDRLYRELARVDAVVCVLTRHYLDAMWCTAELAVAVSRGCLVIPYRAESGVTHRLIDERQHSSDDPEIGQPQVLARLREQDGSGGSGWREGRNPYPGLAAFTADLAQLFFGRVDEIRLMAQQARETGSGVIALAGPSGCGKSSLLRAGLLPVLAADPTWLVLDPWAPSDDPVYALATTLTATAHRLGRSSSLDSVRRRLDAERGLRELADDLLIECPPARRVLLPIDQAEELFGRGVPPETRDQVARLLAAAIAGPVLVVLSIRSEYLGDLSVLVPVAGGSIGTFLLGPMATEMLHLAIEGPARVAGLRIQPELAQRLLADTASAEALPLLAYTLQQLAEGRSRGDWLTLQEYQNLAARQGYRDLSGVHAVLAARAEQALSAAQQASALSRKAVLAGLVRLVEVDSTGRWIRRTVVQAELSEPMRRAVAVFVDHRLLTTNGQRGEYVRFSHDALLTAWPSLTDTIADHDAALRVARTVEQAAVEWSGADRAPAYLWPADRFAVALRQLAPDPQATAAGPVVELDEAATAFLDATRTQITRTRRRSQFRRARVLVALSVLLIAALVAGGIAAAQASTAQRERDAALHQRDVATQQQRAAAAQALLAHAAQLRTSQIGQSLLLGIAAIRVSPSDQARSALISTLIGSHSPMTLPGNGTQALAVAFSPDGHELFTGYNRVGYLWDVTGGARQLGAIPVNAWGAAFSPDGRLLATVGAGNGTEVWDTAHLSRPLALVPPDGAYITSVAFSPDGHQLLTGIWNDPDPDRDAALVWNVTPTGNLQLAATLRTAGSGSVRGVAYGHDGRIAYTANDDGTIGIWDLQHDTRIGMLQAHQNTVYAVAVSPDGRTLLTSSADQTAALWDLTDPAKPALLSTLTGHRGGVRAIGFSPDGQTVATGGLDNTATLWRISDRTRPVRLDTLSGDSQGLWALTFNPGGKTLVTSSFDGSVIVWDVIDDAQPATLSTLPAQVAGSPPLAYRPDGRVLASGGPGWDATLWDVTDPRSPQQLSTLAGHQGAIFTLAFRPDGQLLATTGDDDSVLLWDVAHPAAPEALATIHIGTGVGALGFTRDGRTLAVGDNDGQAILWDVTDPARPHLLSHLHVASAPLRVAVFSPDDRTLVTGSTDTSIQTWNVTDPAQPTELARFTDDNSVYSGEFGPDGHTLALAEEGRKATLWDLRDPAVPQRLSTMTGQSSSVYTAEFSPDGLLLATGGLEKAVIIWNISDPRQPSELIQRAGFPGPIGPSPFSPDGRTLAISSGGTAILWDVNDLEQIVAQPARAACAIIGRGLTPEQWKLAGVGFPYQPTC